jgi:hypothetical protein
MMPPEVFFHSNSATNDAKAKAIRKTACLHMEKILSYT